MRKHGRNTLFLRTLIVVLTITIATVCIYLNMRHNDTIARTGSLINALHSHETTRKIIATNVYETDTDLSDIDVSSLTKLDVEDLTSVDIVELMSNDIFGSSIGKSREINTTDSARRKDLESKSKAKESSKTDLENSSSQVKTDTKLCFSKEKHSEGSGLTCEGDTQLGDLSSVADTNITDLDVENFTTADVVKLRTNHIFGSSIDKNGEINITDTAQRNDSKTPGMPEKYKSPTQINKRPIFVRIYKENEVYDKYGLWKVGNESGNDTLMDVILESIIDVDKETIIDPPTTKPGKTANGDTPVSWINALNRKTGPMNLFINCEESFTRSTELFMKTYPESHDYLIITFFADKSYDLFIQQYSNTILVPAFAADYNMSGYMDVQLFGSQHSVNISVTFIDIASWILQNTNKKDNVILKMDSKRERDIVKRLIETSAVEHVDKYYTTNSEFANSTTDIIKTTQVHYWDTGNMTYSDFEDIHKQLGDTPGRILRTCTNKSNNDSFALVLYSRYGSANALKVLELLWKSWKTSKFSSSLFVPAEFIQRNMADIKYIFQGFNVGVVYSHDIINDAPELNLMRNELIFAVNLFKRENITLNDIFLASEVKHDGILQNLSTQLNISFFLPGRDITYLIPNMVSGEEFTDVTGKLQGGGYLTVDIDQTYSEYLVIAMVKRYAHRLISTAECE